MNQQFLVVSASLIDLLFEKTENLGKGMDLIYGITSTIYIVKKKQNNQTLDFDYDWGRHALQIYEKLNIQVFQEKVKQLQQAMIEYLNPYSTRIILIASEQLSPQEFNLHVVYEFQNVKLELKSIREYQKEGLNYQETIKFLGFLCKNYLLGSQHTKEFLEINPENIFINDKNNYIISNFGITFFGTIFNRIFLPSTDPIYQEKVHINIFYSYAFRAALLTLCLMTQIDPQDFFQKNGQFKVELLDNLLYLISDEEEKQSQRKFINSIPEFFDILIYTKAQDYQEQYIKNQGNQFQYVKSERFLKHKYKKELLSILKKLLNVKDIKSRSIFLDLIQKSKNLLSQAKTYQEIMEDQNNYQKGIFQNTQLHECGIIQTDKVDQANKKGQIIKYCGQFENGQYIGAYNQININQAEEEYILYNLQCNLTFRYVNQKLLYLTDNIVSPINPIDTPEKESIYYFKGEIQSGQFKKGISYQQDKTIFDGIFQNNKPFQGKMTYPNEDVFEGTMDGFNKKKGRLITKDKIIEGIFVNDKISEGQIKYNKDGGIFKGKFNDGLKKKGVYKYPYSSIEYEGSYENNKRHGKGIFIDKSQKDCIQKVMHENGKCVTKLNEHFEKLLIDIFLKIKQNNNMEKVEYDDV